MGRDRPQTLALNWTLGARRRRALVAGQAILRGLATAVLVIVLIDIGPVAGAGITLSTLAKGLIAVPVGILFAARGPNRRTYAIVLAATLCALLIAFVMAGYDQRDPAVDASLLSLFFLAAWITAPYAVPRRVRSRYSPDRAESRIRLDFAAVRRALSALAAPWWLEPGRLVLSALAAAAAILASIFIVLGVDAFAGRIDASSALRIAELAADAVVGAAAVFFISVRQIGAGAAALAAVFWACSGIRLDSAALPFLVPTASLPVLVALALSARRSGTLAGIWLAVAVSVAGVVMALYWPLLAVIAILATGFTLWSAGYRRDAFLQAAPLLLVTMLAAAAVRSIGAKIDLLAAINDPTHAAIACASGCDGGLPWEFFYPSAFGGLYASTLVHLYRATLHWGNYQLYSIAPGWAQLTAAAWGAIVLARNGRAALLKVWLLAIGLGIFLALPSHYLALTLPSITRAVTDVAPRFEFGAQFALLSAFFVALLGAAGAEALLERFRAARMWVVPLLVLAVAFDVVSLPPLGHPATALQQTSAYIRSSSGAPPPKVAFYPFLTQDYGPEYGELVRVARRQGDALVNADYADYGLADLTAAETIPRLRRIGVQYVVLSLSDYTRRRDILDEAHVLLPLDQEGAAKSWIVPDPSSLSALTLVRSRNDGTFLFTL